MVEYYYDGMNRRVKKDLPGAGVDVIFLYDGWRCIEEKELDGANWEARRQFVYGGLYIDEVLFFDKDTDSDGNCIDAGGSTRYLYAQNNNYNVMALTDLGGAAVERVKYDPYGSATVTVEQGQSATGNPLLFQGQRYDSETGLYYFRNRYYSPTLGRFLQRDPIADFSRGTGVKRNISTNDLEGNLYCFVGDQPASHTDPLGLVRGKRGTYTEKAPSIVCCFLRVFGSNDIRWCQVVNNACQIDCATRYTAQAETGNIIACATACALAEKTCMASRRCDFQAAWIEVE